MADETQEERFERIVAAQLVAREQAKSLAPKQPVQETPVAKALRQTRERIAESQAATERRPATPEEKTRASITPSTTPQATNGNGQTPVITQRVRGALARSVEAIEQLEEEQ